MKFLPREQLATKVRELAGVGVDDQKKGLKGVRLARVCLAKRDAMPSEEQQAKIRAQLGGAIVGRLVPFVISTPERASDGHTLDPMGCDSDDFERAPAVFWSHEWSGWRAMPSRAAARIGTSTITKSKDNVTAMFGAYTREFSEALDGGFSYAMGEIAALQGHRASVGFDVVEAAVADEETRTTIPWALDVSVWRLGEWSFVNFGADDDAISAGREAGVDVSLIARGLERFLDDVSAASGMSRARLARAWAEAMEPGRPRVFDLAPQALPANAATSADLADTMAGILARL